MTRPSSRWIAPALGVLSVLIVVARTSQGLPELLIDTLSPAETMAIGGNGNGLTNGFPSGAELTAISAPLRLYGVFDAVGLGVVGATQWMIGLEALALFLGVYAAVKILRPHVSTLVAGSAATVATVGFALNGHNLANFGFLFGWNYGFATAVAMVALAFALRCRWTACAGAIVGVALIHSVIAVLAVLSVAPLVAHDIVRKRFSLRWRPITLASVGAAAYLLSARGDVQLPSGQLDVTAYLARVRAFQSHYFFKFSVSFLRTFAEDIASWLIAVVLILVVGMVLRRSGEAMLANRTAGMLATIGLLSAVGWAHSNLDRPDVTLLVLTLHRSSTFVNLLLLALVVPLLFERAAGRRQMATAAAVGAWCLLPNPIDHARVGAIVLGAALVWAVTELRRQPSRAMLATAAAIAPIAGLAVHFLIVSPGIAGSGWRPFLSAVRRDGGLLLSGVALAALVVAGRHTRADRRVRVGAASFVVVLGTVALLMGSSALDNPRAFTGPAKDRRADLIDVAGWARTETDRDDEFLLPLRDDGFGWRTFAERASAGLPREWLHYAFLYSRDERVMDEGTRRAALLGIDVDAWLRDHAELGAGNQLVAELAARFDAMPDEQVVQFARALDADFMVTEAATPRLSPCFSAVYSNATFVVLEIHEECPPS